MNHPSQSMAWLPRRLAITVRGVVQGVGFRPFVYNTARRLGLGGWVLNESDAVRMEVQGDRAALDDFLDALRNAPPPQSRIDAIDIVEVGVVDLPGDGGPAVFEIRMSGEQASPRPTIPADLATCAECLAEINDPNQRRYRYPFTNCTHCGPRWSIIAGLPYDRPRTSMAAFAMCADCRAEYENPADRRFHAQPIACPRCGPSLKLLDARGAELAVGDAALSAASEALVTGRVVAIKGLGGFQLLVDATNAAAVATLRERKHRPDRPFAVMFPSAADVRRCCDVNDEAVQVLSSHRAPIVLLRKLDVFALPACGGFVGDPAVVAGVAPGNPYLGVMLPYTPLHHLLMQEIGRPVVCTSGNLSEEPMVTTTDRALRRLGAIADVLLTHNRPIVRPVDDSVVRMGPRGEQVLRRARGFAPLPIVIRDGCRPADELATTNISPTLLSVGGHLKNTIALCLGGQEESQVILSSHIGDLDSVRSVEVFHHAIDDLLEFFQAKPDAVVCDLHPDYASARHAEALAARWDVPLLRVQHHHAHVATCMAEHALEGGVLGLAWDGTGYGADGTVWGGEALLCDGAKFRRVAHLRTFPLPGGDRAIRQPRRSAYGLLLAILGEKARTYAAAWFTANEIESLDAMVTRNLHSPRTSSMGRLFDAVSALCGLSTVVSFEGQAAMALEYAADAEEQGAYAFGLAPGDPIVIDWEPVVHAILADQASGVAIGPISGRFHNALADMAVNIARRVGCSQVALTGGCFQNVLLANRVDERLSAAGFNVYTHKRTPPGDGGIALGQVYLGLRQL